MQGVKGPSKQIVYYRYIQDGCEVLPPWKIVTFLPDFDC